MTGKTSWYKSKRRQDQVPTRDRHGQKDKKDSKGQTGDKKTKRKPETANKTPSAVLFIERTPNGGLAQRLRQKETEINQIGTKRIKIVERNGDQIQAMLTKSNPWGEPKCDRRDCISCLTSERDRGGECRDSNIVYKSTCKICKETGDKTSYVGETHRSLFERTREHAQDSMTAKEKSHIREHRTGETPRQDRGDKDN